MARSTLNCLLALVASSHAFLTAAASTTQDLVLTVQDPRPVAKAMALLEDRFHQPITYEEGPSIYQDELVDRTRDPKAVRRILQPKPWRVDSDIQVPLVATRGELVSLINRFLRDASKSRGLTRDNFRVLQSSLGLHVVQTFARDRDGAEKPVTPVLDVRITLATQQTDLVSLLGSFTEAVSKASGAKIVVATVPRAFAARTGNIVATSHRARDVLVNLLESQGLALSWHLLYGPTDDAFFLNIGVPGGFLGPLK